MAPSDTSTFFSSPFAVCVSAKAVYGWFKDGNPQVTDAGHEAWGKVSGLQTEIGNLIDKAVTDSGATWSGTAGDAMRSSTSPMATWADLTGTSATSGSTAVAEISSAFRAAQNSVQEPVQVPDKPWYNDFSPWDTDYDDAVDKSQGVDEANMRVINAYADRTNYATSNMPTFEAPADSTAEIDDGKTPPPPKHIEYPNEPVDRVGPGKSDVDGGDDNGSTVGSGERKDQFTPNTDDTSGGTKDTTKPSDVRDGTTRPSDVNDPNRPPVGTPNRPPINTPVGDPPGGVLPFGPNDPRNPANKLTGGGRGGGGGGLGGGGGSRGGLGGGAGGLGAGKGGFGPGGAAAAAGQFGGAAGEGGRAGAGGLGPGGAAAGGRGAAGAGGMGGGHGAKGEGGDDLEHTSKYLQPSDEYFGDGTMVAPPVIGG